MKKALVVVLSVGLGRLAAAQPAGGDEPPPPPDPSLEPTPAPAPAPPPAPTPPPAPPPPPVAHHDVVSEPSEHEPMGFAVGLGIGYALPTSLETPNIASVRLRLASGLTFEPRVALANSSQTQKDSTAMIDTTDSTSQFLLEAVGRLPVVRHGRYELEVIGGALVDITSHNPEGDDNNQTTTALSLVWGLGVAAWLSPHWQLSFDVGNPLVTYTSTKQDTGPGTSTTTSTTNIGIVFDPQVAVMIHLYD